MADEHDGFLKSLDEMGEEQVKRILARGAWNERRTKWAQGWLDALNDTRSERSNRESLAIARSAKNAAWAAAIAAIIAIPIAIGAIVISYLAWTSPHP
ncbi:MAG: hypothetical protein EPN98_03590 [Phenylobacterium sp.]|uniref:hypothetical protein n=1 Tax=Phenylobacterium sp. TaxID=1871053 RepID=UPI001201453D|nr:hypothetical protein [Phenylobacterium sp.]TAL37379.1 MAG: hypothetical protein EPN98_03590 [Phenylobacterium sp.]